MSPQTTAHVNDKRLKSPDVCMKGLSPGYILILLVVVPKYMTTNEVMVTRHVNGVRGGVEGGLAAKRLPTQNQQA